MSNLTKPNEASFTLRNGKLSSKTSDFKQRIQQARSQAEDTDPQTMPNRICLMLDCSGSMDDDEDGRRRIDLLKDAVQNFVSRCSFANTSIAISTFPPRANRAMPLTSQASLIINFSLGLDAAGGTPLHGCLVKSLTEVSMTRGVVVSDGCATDWYEREDGFGNQSVEDIAPHSGGNILKLYKEQGIPIDCVHISSTTSGEELLRRIASETGGIFMKFSDVNAFSKAFGYLAPSFRAMLTSGSVSASELGAKEIK